MTVDKSLWVHLAEDHDLPQRWLDGKRFPEALIRHDADHATGEAGHTHEEAPFTPDPETR